MSTQATNDPHLVQNELTAREAKVASKTYGKFIAALAVGFVLLMGLFAASGTKMIDITALHFKAQDVGQPQAKQSTEAQEARSSK